MNITPSYGAPRNHKTNAMAWIAACLIIVMLLAQLYAYEDFAITLSSVLPFNDMALTTVIVAGIVVAELLALPYLLGMYIGKLLRVFSASLAMVVATFWLILSLTNSHAQNSGIFSTALELPGGVIAALLSVALFVCVIKVIIADSRFRHHSAS